MLFRVALPKKLKPWLGNLIGIGLVVLIGTVIVVAVIISEGTYRFDPQFRKVLLPVAVTVILAMMVFTFGFPSMYREGVFDYHGSSKWIKRLLKWLPHVVLRVVFLGVAAGFLCPFIRTSPEARWLSHERLVMYPQGHPELAQEVCGPVWFNPFQTVFEGYPDRMPVDVDGITVICADGRSAALQTPVLQLNRDYGSAASYYREIRGDVLAVAGKIKASRPGISPEELIVQLEEQLPVFIPNMRFRVDLKSSCGGNTA